MATFVLEDLSAAIEAWVFPRVHQDYGALLRDDAVVCVKGRLDRREEPAKLVVMEVRAIDLQQDEGAPLRLRVPDSLPDETFDRLKRLLHDHPGPSPVFVHLARTVFRLPDEFSVDTGNGLLAEIRVLLGPDCVLP